ncbi:MAG: hypothetical protein JKX78_04560 [Alteromonadaceae bacterium]|nr:hypothetical protein [Alteromonadaceae bacterium]
MIAIIVILLLLGGGIWGWPLVAGMLGLASITDKPSALKNITQLMHTYNITVVDVENAYQAAAIEVTPTAQSKGNIAKTLFIYLGIIFIIAGIGNYISEFWDSMSAAMRVLLTLGMGCALLVVLLFILHKNKTSNYILPLTIAGMFMMTVGWFILLDEIFGTITNWPFSELFVYGMMSLLQIALFNKYRRTILAFTALIFIYAFIYVGFDMLGISITYIIIIFGISLILVSTALEKTPHRVLIEPALLLGIIALNSGLFNFLILFDAANWVSFIIGICLMVSAYGLQKSNRYSRLTGLCYLAGSIMVYSSLFDLVQKTSLELLYLGVTSLMLYICVLLKSRVLLLTTVIAMLAFISYYSTEYFSDSLGWPVTLIIMGFAFLGIGTIAIKVKHRLYR